MTASSDQTLLALDVGDKRIGVAIASLNSKLPKPLATLDDLETSIDMIQRIVGQEHVKAIVIGLPRNLAGQDTKQTKIVQDYGQKVSALGLPIFWQDEALTSQKAETELRDRGVSYNKGQVDALAATYLLDDFLSENRERQLE